MTITALSGPPIPSLLSGGTGQPPTWTDLVKTINAIIAVVNAGGGSAAGLNTQIQYNNASAFGGVTGATSDGTTLTLVAPVLGTPASITLTNGIGLPIGTGISGLGAGIATFLATPTSANLATALTDETGSGSLVFATSPTLVTPVLGVGTGTSLALGGATIGADALGVTGTSTLNGNLTINAASLLFSGNQSSAAWTTNGLRVKGAAATLTDTTSSGTVATAYTDLFGASTIAASAATTFTNYFGTYLKDPVAGANVTLTNKWALGADSVKFGGQVTISSSGVTTFSNSVILSGANIQTNSKIIFGGGAGPTITAGITSNIFQVGTTPTATPAALLVNVGESSRAGTDSDVAGGNGTVQSGLGTGIGTITTLALRSSKVAASGTSTQTYVTGLLINAGTAVLTNYTVANLPAAATAGVGATAFVTDASTTLVLGLGGAVAGGGANKVPVYSDGTNWLYG